MIGLAFSLAAALSAALVSRREPRHAPIELALTAAAIQAGTQLSGRLGLVAWGAVAWCSGRAYLATWEAPLEARALWGAAGVLALFGEAVAPDPRSWWAVATWGPFCASTAVGVWALLRRSPEAPAITHRVALALLVSDACMLAFASWPDVQIWQGRVSAVVIAALHVAWLIGGTRSPAS